MQYIKMVLKRNINSHIHTYTHTLPFYNLQSGMTPLQHAAFRGKPDIAEFLLRFGANVNSNMHENGYTTLMFAALSGR